MFDIGRIGRAGAWAVAVGIGSALLCANAAAGADTGLVSATESPSMAAGAARAAETRSDGRSRAIETPARPRGARNAGPARPARAQPVAASAAADAAVPAADPTKAVVSVAAPAGSTIGVGAIRATRIGNEVTGLIETASTRGLSLKYSIADMPDRGARIALGQAGEFTLTPDQPVLAAGGTEKFSILITEKTPLETLLEQVPLVGGVVPPVFTALRATPLLGEFLAPLIGYAALARVSIGYRDDTTTGEPPAALAPAGWNIYSWQAQSEAVVDGIGRQQPGLVRWFVEMDRFLEDETQPFRPSRQWSWDTDTGFDRFFETLAANHTTLVVALWNKYDWARSMRACETCGWPDVEKYAAFVRDLDAEARKFGVAVVFEALNEPDLRWASLNAATNIGATENFTGEWFTGLPQGWAGYRGGTGALWQQMHGVVETPFASGGIISLYTAEITLAQRLSGNYPTTSFSTRWIDATAPLVEYTSFHRYGLNEADSDPRQPDPYVEWVYNEWSLWRDRKGHAVPFYIGEIGPTPTGSVGLTDAEAARMRAIHAALDADPRFEDAYLGMTAHVFSDTDAPNLWETSRGWWDPAFTVLDVAGRT